jgi:hypothetical protein
MKNQQVNSVNTPDDFDLVADQLISFIQQQVPGMSLANKGSDYFRLEQDSKQHQGGILEVTGMLREEDDNVIVLKFDVLRTGETAKIDAARLFELLSGLSEKAHLAEPDKNGAGANTFRVELKVQANLMSMTRSSKFMEEVARIDELAHLLQKEIPEQQDYQDLLKAYKHVSDLFQPVLPFTGALENPGLTGWLAEVLEAHHSGLCQAIIVRSALQERFILAALSGFYIMKGSSLGYMISPVISASKLPDLLPRAPGAVAVPAIALSMGSNLYERSNEMLSLLQGLTYSKTPAIFIGEENQLQSLFHGGQGGKSDPLLPVVRHLPEIGMEEMIRFGVENESARNGGLTENEKEACIKIITDCFSTAEQLSYERVLLPVITDTVKRTLKSIPPKAQDIISLRDRLNGYKHALSGLSEVVRSERLSHVQRKLIEKLVNPELFRYFNEHIFAQDNALQDLCSRLQMEVLTRPLYQPIRYCAQGTPGIGKSESTVLLARLLGMPYVNIDAASIPDIYTGSAQLLGSGRGLVGSYQSGRLEQAAKHRIGAVVEVSDLDHASPAVRCALADLFLQVLETGEAQSASGVMFSCANLIFVFSVNLPNGQDEYVHRSMGYSGNPSEKEVRKRIYKELKKTFSTAFISRIGNPVIFNPLTGQAKSRIVEEACLSSLSEAAKRMNVSYTDIAVSEKTIDHILNACTDLDLTSGARGIIEKSRIFVAEAFLKQSMAIRDKNYQSLKLETENNNTILSLK